MPAKDVKKALANASPEVINELLEDANPEILE